MDYPSYGVSEDDSHYGLSWRIQNFRLIKLSRSITQQRNMPHCSALSLHKPLSELLSWVLHIEIIPFFNINYSNSHFHLNICTRLLFQCCSCPIRFLVLPQSIIYGTRNFCQFSCCSYRWIGTIYSRRIRVSRLMSIFRCCFISMESVHVRILYVLTGCRFFWWWRRRCDSYILGRKAYILVGAKEEIA